MISKYKHQVYFLTSNFFVFWTAYLAQFFLLPM